jgi:uncharacterized protein with von Willebrand factor type A (vWA) domain
MWKIDPIQMQAILYIQRNIYRACIQQWDWKGDKRRRKRRKERQRIVRKYTTSV